MLYFWQQKGKEESVSKTGGNCMLDIPWVCLYAQMCPPTLYSRESFLLEVFVVLLKNTNKARKLSDPHVHGAVM